MTYGIGAQTVTLVSEGQGAVDRKGIPAQVPTDSTVQGCLIIPTQTKEEITNVAYAVNNYAMYALPYPNVLALKPDDLVVDASGAEYHVAGRQVWNNVNGTAHHVKVLLWQPSGLNAPPSVQY